MIEKLENKELTAAREKLAASKELLFQLKLQGKKQDITQKSIGGFDIDKYKKNVYIISSILLVATMITITIIKKRG